MLIPNLQTSFQTMSGLPCLFAMQRPVDIELWSTWRLLIFWFGWYVDDDKLTKTGPQEEEHIYRESRDEGYG